MNKFFISVPQNIENVLIEVQGTINDILCEGITGYVPVNATDVNTLIIRGWLESIPDPLMFTFENLNALLMSPVYWGVIKTQSRENGFEISGGSFDIDGQV